MARRNSIRDIAAEQLLLANHRVEAIESLRETEESIAQGLQDLKQILKDDEKLTIYNNDDFLVQFLRARKHNIPRAAEMVRKFFKLRTTVVDMQHLFRPSLHENLFNSGATSVLSRRDSKGRHVIVFRISKWDPSKISFDEYMAGSFLLLDEALSTIDTQYNGMVVVVDLKSLGFSHVRQIGLRRIRTIASLLQDSYPARFKEIHFVNNPAIFGTVYLAAKPFLKEKIVKRIFIHGSDVKGLQKLVSLSHLPTSLGGRLTDDTIINKDAIASILTKDAYYEELLKFGYK